MVITRNTVQREKIMHFLQSVDSHPTAEVVYEHVKKDMPQVTLATVYRNLNLLAEQSKIKRFEINKHYHYDAKNYLHGHAICEKCGSIIDIMEEKIINSLRKIKLKNFEIKETDVFFKGNCMRC
tara:strand:+ start:56 stop:427 length:372 start_codon:yes stop_codon:yes gene_type:complete